MVNLKENEKYKIETNKGEGENEGMIVAQTLQNIHKGYRMF